MIDTNPLLIVSVKPPFNRVSVPFPTTVHNVADTTQHQIARESNNNWAQWRERGERLKHTPSFSTV